jgi:hypothetical protein
VGRSTHREYVSGALMLELSSMKEIALMIITILPIMGFLLSFAIIKPSDLAYKKGQSLPALFRMVLVSIMGNP